MTSNGASVMSMPTDFVGSIGGLLADAVTEQLPWAVEFRHALHARPELSGHEQATTTMVLNALGNNEVHSVAKTGALIRFGPVDGPCVAVRAELDALPLIETTGVSWASNNQVAHACGHDVHLSALSALCRATMRVQLPFGLLAVLQPREEVLPSGAEEIVHSASFLAQNVGAIVGAHVQPVLQRGVIAAVPGPVNAGVDNFEIVVHGVPGHAGYPHLAIDPVVALCSVVSALQQIVSRRSDPTHSVVLSVGVLKAGSAPNVIPSEARAFGTLRTLQKEDRAGLLQMVDSVVQATSAAHGCTAEIVMTTGEPPLVNDEQLAHAVGAYLESAGFSVDRNLRSCGADDFAFYAEMAPSLMMFVGTDDKSGAGLHHPGFLPSDDTVGHVAQALLAGYLAGCELINSRTERSHSNYISR